MPKMSEKDFQAKIDNLMKKLDCTAEEAKEILKNAVFHPKINKKV